jgi:pyruvate kinase
MKEQTAVRAGDIVHLNSGSPDLKVVNINGDKIQVEWVNERGNLERSTLPRICLL